MSHTAFHHTSYPSHLPEDRTFEFSVPADSTQNPLCEVIASLRDRAQCQPDDGSSPFGDIELGDLRDATSSWRACVRSFLQEHEDDVVLRVAWLPPDWHAHIPLLLASTLNVRYELSSSLADCQAVFELASRQRRLVLPLEGEAFAWAKREGELNLVIACGDSLFLRRYVRDVTSPKFRIEARRARSFAQPYYDSTRHVLPQELEAQGASWARTSPLLTEALDELRTGRAFPQRRMQRVDFGAALAKVRR